MSDTLRFPRSKKLRHLHIAGAAILAVGGAMLVAGQLFGGGPLQGLIPLFGGFDLILGAALISYRREVVIDPVTRMVRFRRWILFPVRESTFIPGAFDHVEIRGTPKGGYTVQLGGNRTLFVDGPTTLEQARSWARELNDHTGWRILENREMDR